MTDADLQDDVERAATLCALRRHHQAITLLRSVVATSPDTGRAWCYLAVAYLGVQDADNALRSGVRAAALEPDSEWPLRLLSIAFDRLGRHDEAVAAAARAVGFDPGNWLTHAQLANALVGHGKTRQAHSVAQTVAAMAPDSAITHRLLATIAHRRRHYTQAETHLRQAMAIDPTSAETLSDLAFFQLRRLGHLNPTRMAQSSARIADAIGSDPSHAGPRVRLDLLLTYLLRTTAVIVVVGAVDVLRLLRDNPSTIARLLPAILLLLPLVYAVRTVTHMQPAIQHRLRAVALGERRIQIAIATESVAVSAVLLASAAPAADRIRLSVVAAVGAFATLLALRRHQRTVAAKLGRRPAKLFTTISFYVIAVALWLTAFAAIAFAIQRTAGIITGTLFAAAGVAIILYAHRRR